MHGPESAEVERYRQGFQPGQPHQLRSSLGLFSRAFPGPIKDVQPEEIDAWLRGGDLAPVTLGVDPASRREKPLYSHTDRCERR